MKNKKITVCLASYNGEKYIAKQLESILLQLPNDYDEIIVSDDGSTDNTLEIVKGVNDNRIIILDGPKQGVIKNFEFLLKRAQGDIVFLSDQDDVWHPNKVSKYLIELDKYSLVYSNVSIINEKGDITNEHLYPLGIDKSGFVKNLIKNSSIGATIAFRKEILNKALPFPSNIEMHDTWLGLIASIFFNVKYLEKPYLEYRRHGNNVSSASEKSTNSLKEKVLIRLRYLKSLLLRITNVS